MRGFVRACLVGTLLSSSVFGCAALAEHEGTGANLGRAQEVDASSWTFVVFGNATEWEELGFRERRAITHANDIRDLSAETESGTGVPSLYAVGGAQRADEFFVTRVDNADAESGPLRALHRVTLNTADEARDGESVAADVDSVPASAIIPDASTVTVLVSSDATSKLEELCAEEEGTPHQCQ